MESGPSRARALSGILAFLPRDKRKGVAAEALRSAMPIAATDSGTTDLLSDLLPHLEAGERSTVLQETLAAARALPDIGPAGELVRPLALLRLAKFFPDDERISVVSEVRTIVAQLPESGQFTLPSPRAMALFELMPYVPRNEHQHIFTEALRLARNVSTENRALALAQLSAHMTEPMLQEALEEALAPGTRLRQQVLDELAPRLSDSLIRQALNSLQAIDDFKNQQLLPWLLLTAGDCEAGLDAAAQLDTSFKYSPFTAALTQFVDRLTQPALVVCNLESGTSIC